MNRLKIYKDHKNSFFLSYSQIFFSNSKILGVLLFLVSFMDAWSGLFGAFSVLVSLFFSHGLGFNKQQTQSGVYTYNSLLTGLGIGLYFEPSFSLLFFSFVVSLLVLLLSVSFSRLMSNYGLPFLSIPFLLGMWLVDLSGTSFAALGLSERSIFLYNDLFSIGGLSLIQFYDWSSSVPILYSLEVYFLSLGAIFFQYQVLAGILISIGILIHSRIAFSLSLIGFYAAWLFYYFMGASLYDLSYSYIGFNFILTAVALGGFFLIPNKYSFGWMLIILPVVVLTTIASIALFSHLGIGIYALPFNAIVLLFLYANKLRNKQKYGLQEVKVQHFSPEHNLYFALEAENRFQDLKFLPLRLPVQGEWTISQGHNGAITHKEKWQHAWDFIITKANGEQFNNLGKETTDYMCYNKAVLASYDGVVQEIADGIDDNIIGLQNLRENWGNTIIIKHSDYLFSKYSHLKKGSLVVQKGDWIKKGQQIALVGNSGRSPFPHLHFQLQKTPFIGSETIAYPFASYLSRQAENEPGLQLYNLPKLHEKVKMAEANELLLFL
ncbi:MAG: peptidase M23 [Bacteroidetes bacterium 4572_77]|nr:MAG: peptidase M23 [Bacteroidetes bacterium 4572_77]